MKQDSLPHLDCMLKLGWGPGTFWTPCQREGTDNDTSILTAGKPIANFEMLQILVN
jgi:hypothetical protein